MIDQSSYISVIKEKLGHCTRFWFRQRIAAGAALDVFLLPAGRPVPVDIQAADTVFIVSAVFVVIDPFRIGPPFPFFFFCFSSVFPVSVSFSSPCSVSGPDWLLLFSASLSTSSPFFSLVPFSFDFSLFFPFSSDLFSSFPLIVTCLILLLAGFLIFLTISFLFFQSYFPCV